MSTLALIPARAGSRGLPGKNLRRVGGQTLVALAVQVALASGVADDVVVSSGGAEILAEGARAGGTPESRPARLADDRARSIDVVRYHLQSRPEADLVVLLQPTSPLRRPSDIAACVEALTISPSAVTVSPVSHPWEWSVTVDAAGRLEPVAGWAPFAARRQDLTPSYVINGAVYAIRREVLDGAHSLVSEGTAAIVMPADRSVDIDGPEDLALAEVLWKQLQDPSR